MHGSIAVAMPGLRKYAQDHPAADGPFGAPPCGGIAELWFEDAALQVALASPQGQATAADAPNFADLTRLTYLLSEKVAVVEGPCR